MSGLDWRPRRSCLFVPASNERALSKARRLGADAVIIDLEDAVAASAKDEARTRVAGLMDEGAYADQDVLVRINSIGGDWGGEDMAALCPKAIAGVVGAKLTHGEEVAELDDALTAAGLSEDAELWAMIETPAALINVAEIAAAGKATRLSGLLLGLNDLAAATSMRAGAERTPFHAAMAMVVFAARAHGLIALDAVYNNFADREGFARECMQGRAFGFDGKTLIHPDQIEPANNVFGPSPEEVAHAKAIMEAFAKAPDAAVVNVEGRMAERLHLTQAELCVGKADIIEARKGAKAKE